MTAVCSRGLALVVHGLRGESPRSVVPSISDPAALNGRPVALVSRHEAGAMKHDDQVYRWMTPCPQTVQPAATMFDALVMMRQHGIRHLPVVDRGDLVGIVSERDLAFADRFLEGRDASVASMMSRDPYVAVPNALLSDACASMARDKYGSAVIVDRGNVVGVFTAVDALRAIAATHPREASLHPVPHGGD
jgi:acetoin utilization protein AcuB